MAQKYQTLQILLVEDDSQLSFLYETKLRQDGFNVSVAYDGEAGFILAKNNDFDLILLDIMMPKVDGYEMLKMLKNNTQTKKIPVIIFSNLSQKDEIEKGLKLGARDFIVKTSVTPAQLSERVKKILSGK